MSIAATQAQFQNLSKKDQWIEKSPTSTWDIVKKVALVATVALTGIGISFAGFLLAGYFQCIFGSICLLTETPFYIALIGTVASTAFLLENLDFKNYQNPNTAAWELKKIRSSSVPLPLSKFIKLNRYGIISDAELQKRIVLEPSVKNFLELAKKGKVLLKDKAAKQESLQQRPNIPSLQTWRDSVKKEIQTLNENIVLLTTELDEYKDSFTEFNQSIEDFNPYCD